MQLNEYFRREEFACKCGCGFDTVDCNLLLILTSVRKHFNSPVIINSGCRCEKHNKKVGGTDNSTHKTGRAVDIRVKDVPPPTVYDFLCKSFPTSCGFGLYDSWVHVDSRDLKARWNSSKYPLNLMKGEIK
jgi:uncharacterized protein YcbK (DUF882 family)